MIQRSLRAGRPLPQSIQDAPELQLGLEMYWDAFWDLSTCRNIGFGTGPISWLAMREYGLMYEFDEDQMDDLFHHVRVMDNAYLKHFEPKNKKKGGT